MRPDRSLIPTPPGMGELWQGGVPAGVREVNDFDLVVNCSYELPDIQQSSGGLYFRLDLDDARMYESMQRTIRLASGVVASVVRDGLRVLVHCTQGWNRSGVVVARSLIYLGVEPATAICLVQEYRDPMALCNAHFTAWLMREGPSLQSDLARQEGEA